MSQHTYKCGEIKVLAGWDRPLGYLFLVIENDISDIPIYSNLDDPKAENAQDTIHFQEVLRTLSIPVPKGFWLALEGDRKKNKGNYSKRWTLN